MIYQTTNSFDYFYPFLLVVGICFYLYSKYKHYKKLAEAHRIIEVVKTEKDSEGKDIPVEWKVHLKSQSKLKKHLMNNNELQTHVTITDSFYFNESELAIRDIERLQAENRVLFETLNHITATKKAFLEGSK